MGLSMFESSVVDSFQKTCKRYGFSVTYANRIFQITENGTTVFEGDLLQTQQFLSSRKFTPKPH